MNPEKNSSPAAEQPVAYDVNGRPLYARPQAAEQSQEFFHVGRAVEPIRQTISPETKAKHEASVKKYPFLNLSESEYIIKAIRRHPIGLLIPVSVAGFLVILTIVAMLGYPMLTQTGRSVASMPAYGDVIFVCFLFIILFSIGGYIATWVYLNNKFFLTNESVIQEIQTSLFSKHEQTVSLGSIEDASFNQKGIIQSLFGYGSIRLSTEGDETTYRFHYVANPKTQIATLNNAVEAFKNGRPVED